MSQESRTPRIHIKRRVELSSLQNEPSSAHNEPESSETSKKSVDISSLKEKYNIQSQTPRIHIKRRVELSSLQNEPSSAHNEPESSETSKKSVDISSLKEKYNIRLSRSYKEQTSAPQIVHFSEELESTIPETIDKLKTEKLEKSQENINQMKEEIDFLANINQQFGDSGTKSEIIPSKRPKGQKLKSKKIAKTNKGKRVFGNDSEEDTESDDEKNEKTPELNEMKTIIKTINSEFSLNYDQTFTSANNCEIRRKLISELQKSLAPKFRPSVTQLTKWLNSIHKSRRVTTRIRNSRKLLKDLRRVHANNRQNNKKLRRIKAAKELFRKNDPNITDYNKESLLRMLADRTFYSPEMSDTDEEDHSKTVVNVYDLSWQSAKLKHLLRNVLDPQLASNTTAQLQRKRNYSDEVQRYNFPPPAKVPNWACNEQEDVVYDTEFVQTEGEDELSFASTSSSKISAEQ
ncbi:hypothetical protein Glove_123g140 [Diversispora epigaea]|uniref:Uncharacterized protein n=1 Tax=Diversispora epigaea TaxID=1348612 RepID=A0A397J820_9GLOM|nr:hypothetical protein Glove_123g140 [Diversispora epigaea]